MKGILVGRENELLEYNLRVLERHDKDIECIKDEIRDIKTMIGVVKILGTVLVSVLGLVGSITLVVKILQGTAP